jgi:hypothetical protein
LKKPIIKIIVGKGNNWKGDEIALLTSSEPDFNFQIENPNISKHYL